MADPEFRERAPAHPPAPLTYQDCARPPDDGKRYELLEGEIVVSPSPNTRHQEVSGRLHYALHGWAQRTDAGKVFAAPCDVVLSPHDVVQPELLFIAREHRSRITADNIQGPPDLVAEILSPATAERDLDRKRRLYERHGVAKYWIVDPNAQSLTAFRRRGDTLVPETPLGPGGGLAPRGPAGAGAGPGRPVAAGVLRAHPPRLDTRGSPRSGPRLGLLPAGGCRAGSGPRPPRLEPSAQAASRTLPLPVRLAEEDVCGSQARSTIRRTTFCRRRLPAPPASLNQCKPIAPAGTAVVRPAVPCYDRDETAHRRSSSIAKREENGMPLPAKRLLSAWEFERMAQERILGEDERLELVEGEILQMSPIGPRHAACVNRLTKLLFAAVQDRLIVSVHNPLRLGERSELQPDLALLRRRPTSTRRPIRGRRTCSCGWRWRTPARPTTAA